MSPPRGRQTVRTQQRERRTPSSQHPSWEPGPVGDDADVLRLVHLLFPRLGSQRLLGHARRGLLVGVRTDS